LYENSEKVQKANRRKEMSELQKIRIKLKAYDHALLDQSAAKIVETAKKPALKFPAFPSNREGNHHNLASRPQIQGQQRTVRTKNTQETDRHHKRHCKDYRRTDQIGTACRRGHRNQIIKRDYSLSMIAKAIRCKNTGGYI
jgi:ribosomal protein S10